MPPCRGGGPGEALRATVEETNRHHVLAFLVGWCFLTKYTFTQCVLNRLKFLDAGNLSKCLVFATEVATVVLDLADRGAAS